MTSEVGKTRGWALVPAQSGASGRHLQGGVSRKASLSAPGQLTHSDPRATVYIIYCRFRLSHLAARVPSQVRRNDLPAVVRPVLGRAAVCASLPGAQRGSRGGGRADTRWRSRRSRRQRKIGRRNPQVLLPGPAVRHGNVGGPRRSAAHSRLRCVRGTAAAGCRCARAFVAHRAHPAVCHGASASDRLT